MIYRNIVIIHIHDYKCLCTYVHAHCLTASLMGPYSITLAKLPMTNVPGCAKLIGMQASMSSCGFLRLRQQSGIAQDDLSPEMDSFRRTTTSHLWVQNGTPCRVAMSDLYL